MTKYKYKREEPGYGAEKSRRYRERHPERIREQNALRSAYKREWESGECPRCGGPYYKRSEMCRPCRDDESEREFKTKAIHYIELREQGLSNVEIERREGLSFNTVAVHLSRAKNHYGMDVPPSPYFKNGRP